MQVLRLREVFSIRLRSWLVVVGEGPQYLSVFDAPLGLGVKILAVTTPLVTRCGAV